MEKKKLKSVNINRCRNCKKLKSEHIFISEVSKTTCISESEFEQWCIKINQRANEASWWRTAYYSVQYVPMTPIELSEWIEDQHAIKRSQAQ